MAWICDRRPDAILKTWITSMSGGARSGGGPRKQWTPNNHTRWKHKWRWHDRGCVWDKRASEWAGWKTIEFKDKDAMVQWTSGTS